MIVPFPGRKAQLVISEATLKDALPAMKPPRGGKQKSRLRSLPGHIRHAMQLVVEVNEGAAV